MPSYADFVLLRTSPSYGGAEIVRARRVGAAGAEEPVHLALFGAHSSRDATLEQRLLDLAEAGAPLLHGGVARITEVGRYDGSLYAAAHLAEGVDLATLLEHERRRRATPEVRFVLAVAFSLARVVQELHDLGDVFTARAPGLAGLFPFGLRPDAIVLRRDGAVLVRALAGVPSDATAPSPYRAPELGEGRASAASDVFTTIQVLRALLAVDVNAQAAPRLPERCGALPTVLVSALQRRPEDRPLIDAVVDTLRHAFADNAPGQSPAALIAAALRREYRSLLAHDSSEGPGDDDVPTELLADLAQRRAAIAAKRTILYPHLARRSPVPASGSHVVPTVAMRVLDVDGGDGADGVDRVFTQEGNTREGSVSSSIPITTSLPSVSLSGSWSDSSAEPASDPGVTVRGSSILDVAVASIVDASNDSAEQTQKLVRDAALDLSSDVASGDDSSPWQSAVEVSSFGSGDELAVETDAPAPPSQRAETVAARPPFAAPVFADSDLEHQDTVEMQQGPVRAPRGVTFGSTSGEKKD